VFVPKFCRETLELWVGGVQRLLGGDGQRFRQPVRGDSPLPTAEMSDVAMWRGSIQQARLSGASCASAVKQPARRRTGPKTVTARSSLQESGAWMGFLACVPGAHWRSDWA